MKVRRRGPEWRRRQRGGGDRAQRRRPILEDDLPRIFEPLCRASTSSATSHQARDDTGLGLGLFIAHEIVQAHGSALTVASSAEDGTTFTVHLPRARHDA